MVNDNLTSFFHNSHGLRQENPLSLFLLVIIMKALGRTVEATTGGSFLSVFSVGNALNETIYILHFLFANDTLILSDEDIQALTLLCFETVSRLKVNLSKSKLVPVGEVNIINFLASLLGCTIASLPMKYLVLPLGAPFKAHAIWDGVIEIVERRLASWKRLYIRK